MCGLSHNFPFQQITMYCQIALATLYLPWYLEPPPPCYPAPYPSIIIISIANFVFFKTPSLVVGSIPTRGNEIFI